MVTATISAGLLATGYLALAGRALGPSAYGLFAAALAIANGAHTLTQPAALVAQRLAADAHGSASTTALAGIVRYGSRWMATAALLFGVLALAWVLVSNAAPWPLAVCVFVVVQVRAVTIVLVGVMRGTHMFGRLARNLLSSEALRLFVGGAAVIVFAKPLIAMLGYLASTLLAWALAWRDLRPVRVHDPQSPRPVVNVRGLLIPVLAMDGYIALTAVDVVVARAVLEPVLAGEYAAVSSLARIVFMAAVPVCTVLLSHVATESARNRSIRPLLRATAVVGVVGVGGAALFAWVAGEWLVAALFGPDFRVHLLPLVFLWSSQCLLAVQRTAAAVLVGIDRAAGLVWLLVPSVVLLALLTFLHESPLQLAVAVTASAVSSVLTTGIVIVRVRPQAS
jgi:O-antigen/teichoic acid export membrane protein